ncbi:MAG: hypothetical protein RR448_07335 [Niameybacter sp.]
MSKLTWIQHKFEKHYKKQALKKEQQFYQNMLRGNDYRGTDVIFNQSTLGWLIVLVTVFLQIISLATTYEGSKVYFGGVNLPFALSAPLLFALAIQLVVFCMSHTIRKHFKIWLILILCMATLCSTYFSYIGIYNHINSPVDYLQERYKQIYGSMTEEYQLIRDKSENGMKSYVFDIFSEVDKTYSALTKQVAEDEALSKKLDGIKVESGKINAQTNALRKPNINNYGDNLEQYYADMAKYNAAVGTMITDTTKQDATLKSELYEQEVQAILGGQTKDAFVESSIETKTTQEQISKLVASMYKLIGMEAGEATIEEQIAAIQDYVLEFILTGNGDRDIFSTVLTNFYTQVVSLKGQNTLMNFKQDLNHYLILADKEESIMKPLEAVMTEGVAEEDAMQLYTAMQTEIKNAAYILNQTKDLENPIDLTSSSYVMHNLYVLPIKNLVEAGGQKAMAWFCLAFAVLIDGLTLLFALMQGREKTPLFAKCNKDIVGKSKEAIEELLIATLMAGDTKSKEGERLQNMLVQLEQFVGKFELIPEGLESGYSMWCDLSKLEKYNGFVAILCQFNLASILTQEEMYKHKGLENLTEEQYVLIKTKFVIWANQKMSDLALKLEYIQGVHDLEADYELEGERV